LDPTARLHVPSGATVLEIGVNVGPVQVQEGHKGHLEVIVEGRSLRETMGLAINSLAIR
jgi:hypothetical protein